MKSLMIAVIGGGDPSDHAREMAYKVGQELARRSAVVVCGGLGGVMEAVCHGAKAEGGTTIGILPGNDPLEANLYVDLPLCTGLGYARNVIVVKSGSAVIAVDGAFGTLSEIAHAVGDGIPVIGLETWDLSINGQMKDDIIRAKDPVDAVEKAIEIARDRNNWRCPPTS